MLSLGAKIVCRTVGAAGLVYTMHDAVKRAKHDSKALAHVAQEDYLERSYDSSRTIDHNSQNEADISKKVFNLRTKSKLAIMWGKTKGAVTGFVESLGDNIVMVGCTSLALLSKGFLAKLGAFGATGVVAYTVLRQGFGVGKEHK